MLDGDRIHVGESFEIRKCILLSELIVTLRPIATSLHLICTCLAPDRYFILVAAIATYDLTILKVNDVIPLLQHSTASLRLRFDNTIDMSFVFRRRRAGLVYQTWPESN